MANEASQEVDPTKLEGADAKRETKKEWMQSIKLQNVLNHTLFLNTLMKSNLNRQLGN